MTTQTHPEFGYLVDAYAGVKYMGIWKVRIVGVGPHKWKGPEKERVAIRDRELIWCQDEAHKPKDGSPGQVTTISRSQVAFTWEELQALFQQARERLAKQYENWIVLSQASIVGMEKRIAESRAAIEGNQASIATLDALVFPLDPHWEGYVAYNDSLDDPPNPYPPGSPEAAEWERGNVEGYNNW